MPQEYVSLFSESAHIERHFSGSLTAGSKFYSDAQEIVTKRAEQELKNAFGVALQQSKEVGRVVLTLKYDRPIGTDALVDLAGQSEDKLHRLVRDSGTSYEAIFTAVEMNQQEIPKTSIVTIIAGPYGQTGKWGIYTIYPGREAPPFPSEKQSAEVREANIAYWKTHGFYATREEIQAHPTAPPETPLAVSGAKLPLHQNKPV